MGAGADERGGSNMSRPGCMAASSVTSHVIDKVQDRQTRDELLTKALDDFRSGKPLAQVARELGFFSDNDIAFVESLPQDTHDEIHSTILGYIDRDEPMTVLIDHER